MTDEEAERDKDREIRKLRWMYDDALIKLRAAQSVIDYVVDQLAELGAKP